VGHVLVVGSSNTDLVCSAERLPRPGETLRGTAFATYAGGKGANQAVAAARAGARVTFAGAVGDDAFGSQRIADLADEGIDVTRVREVAGATSGVALIVVGADADNGIVLVPGANDLVTVAQAGEAVSEVGHDVLALVLEIPFDAVCAAVERNPATALTVLNAAPFDARVRDLLPRIDVLVCNEIESAGLLGRDSETLDIERAAVEIRDFGARAVVVTAGSAGVALSDESGSYRISAPYVEAVDTTGAGDAFCGALAAWLADGAPVRDAVRAGVCAGAIAVTRAGAQPSLPTGAEIRALLKRLDD
jgi:ribokinase